MKKEIRIDGTAYLYKIKTYTCGEYEGFYCYDTYFYSAVPRIEKRKKWYLFGPIVEIKQYDCLFVMTHFNIEDPRYSKKDVLSKMQPYLKELQRKKEIERGEII